MGVGASMPARVAMAEGSQHVDHMPSLQDEHAQLTLQPLDLVGLADRGIARHLRFELGGLIFQLRNVRMQVDAEVLGLTRAGVRPPVFHVWKPNLPSANSEVFQPNYRGNRDAEFAGTALGERLGKQYAGVCHVAEVALVPSVRFELTLHGF